MRTRNYKKEYANYHSKPNQKVNRAGRNKARKMVMKTGVQPKAMAKTYITEMAIQEIIEWAT